MNLPSLSFRTKRGSSDSEQAKQITLATLQRLAIFWCDFSSLEMTTLWLWKCVKKTFVKVLNFDKGLPNLNELISLIWFKNFSYLITPKPYRHLFHYNH